MTNRDDSLATTVQLWQDNHNRIATKGHPWHDRIGQLHTTGLLRYVGQLL
jgi:hypothetical protein